VRTAAAKIALADPADEDPLERLGASRSGYFPHASRIPWTDSLNPSQIRQIRFMYECVRLGALPCRTLPYRAIPDSARLASSTTMPVGVSAGVSTYAPPRDKVIVPEFLDSSVRNARWATLGSRAKSAHET